MRKIPFTSAVRCRTCGKVQKNEIFFSPYLTEEQAITKWETNKGVPDISNLIAISDEFGVTLDELIKEDAVVKKKIISDSSSKKWHILVIIYLIAIVAYIAFFAVCHKILMIGFLIATLFMLFFELRIFLKEKIGKRDVKE